MSPKKDVYLLRCYNLVDLYFTQREDQERLGLLSGCRLDYIINEIRDVYLDYRKDVDFYESKK